MKGIRNESYLTICCMLKLHVANRLNSDLPKKLEVLKHYPD